MFIEAERGFLKNNFLYLYLAVLNLCCCVGFSLIVGSGAYSVLVVVGFSLQAASLVGSTGSTAGRFQHLWLPRSRAQAQ